MNKLLYKTDEMDKILGIVIAMHKNGTSRVELTELHKSMPELSFEEFKSLCHQIQDVGTELSLDIARVKTEGAMSHKVFFTLGKDAQSFSHTGGFLEEAKKLKYREETEQAVKESAIASKTLSEEANKLSKDANELSKQANEIAKNTEKKSHRIELIGTIVALIALAFDGYTIYSDKKIEKRIDGIEAGINNKLSSQTKDTVVLRDTIFIKNK